MAASVDLSIVIVCYNSHRELALLLESLNCVDPEISRETIIVDNDSGKETRDWLLSIDDVEMILNRSNRGFGSACNRGAAIAEGRYVLILNPDTTVHDGALAGMVRFMDAHPSAGACGPRLQNPDGTQQRSARRFPTVFHELMEMSGLAAAFPNTRLNHYLIPQWDHKGTRAVDFVIGACLCLRRDALETVEHVFDEHFFMFYEETDLCQRLHEESWTVWFVDDSSVTHVGGTSYRDSVGTVNREVYTHRMHSRFLYHRKYGTPLSTFILASAFVVNGVIRLLLLAIILPFLPEAKRWAGCFHIQKAYLDIQLAPRAFREALAPNLDMRRA